MMRAHGMWLSAILLAGCSDDGRANDGACPSGYVAIDIVAPTIDTATADLVVYGSVEVSPDRAATIPVELVQLGVAPETAPYSVAATLPPRAVVAQSDAPGFSTWHATVPYAVLKDALPALPGKVVLVAVPSFGCSMDEDRAAKAIHVSPPFTVDRPPPPVDAGS